MTKWKPVKRRKKGGSRGSRMATQNYLRISIINDMQKRSAMGSSGEIVAFSIGADVCKQLRWLIGDTVEIQTSDDGLIGLMRHPDGNTLLPQGEAMKLYRGKCMKCRVTFATPDDVVRLIFAAGETVKTIESPIVDTDEGVLVIGEVSKQK